MFAKGSRTLALGGDRLYWADARSIQSAPRTGGTSRVEVEDTGGRVFALQVTDNRLVWITTDAVYSHRLSE